MPEFLGDPLGMLRQAQQTTRDMTRETAERVLEAVKQAGPISLMPNPSMPLTGVLAFVHPDVYAEIRKMAKEAEGKADG